MKTKGQTCLSHEYCTDCPLRVECNVRPIFYSDKEYQEYRKEILQISISIARKMGMPDYLSRQYLNDSMNMMDKRRSKELELYPTYSKK